MELPPALLSTPGFTVQADVLAGNTSLFWLHAISNGVILLAFYSIPLVLLAFLRHRTDFPGRWLLLLLGGFAVLSGTQHLLQLWNPWHPDGGLAGIVKALAALVAIAVACMIRPLWARLVAMPSPDRLLKANREMKDALEKHKQTETELRKLSLAVEHSPNMVLITDREGRIEYCNPSFRRISGYTNEEMKGQRASPWHPDRIAPAARRELWDTLGRGEGWEGEILENNKYGDPYWCLEYVAPIPDERGTIVHYVVMSHDITDLKNSEETIRRLAHFDPLTKLPNRAQFKERLEQTIQDATRDNTAFAVLHLDLDRFKNINDSLGHDLGDKVLVAVADRLCQSLREDDTLARLGGDEFAVILPNLRHPAMAGAAATAIGEAMNRPFEVDGHTLFVTASIGISHFPDNHDGLDQLLKMADSAMCDAKQLGRNQYQHYKESPGRTDKTLALETSLRYAVERGELEVYYQPKFEMASGRCLSAEALLRWRDPEHGLVAPGRFIPIAEEAGLIPRLGEWLLREVCRQIGQWRISGLDLAVAVNLSAQQFRQKNLLARMDTILEETGVDRSRLEFEITESTMMDNPEQTAEILRRMKRRGLALSIDDFGTGYSSLSYLKLFPVDYLKIDRSFVLDIDSSQQDPRIVRAIIALAHSLDLMVVAEGVETRAQFDFLKKHHCDLAQGYFCGPPMPPDELAGHLRLGPAYLDSDS